MFSAARIVLKLKYVLTRRITSFFEDARNIGKQHDTSLCLIDPPLSCEQCKQLFTTKASLEEHIKVTHEALREREICLLSLEVFNYLDIKKE